MIYRTYSQNLKKDSFIFSILRVLASYTSKVYNESLENIYESIKTKKYLNKSENIKKLQGKEELKYLDSNILNQVCYKAHFTIDLYYKLLYRKKYVLNSRAINKPGTIKNKYFSIVFRPEIKNGSIEVPLKNEFIQMLSTIKENELELHKLGIHDKDFSFHFRDKIIFDLPNNLKEKEIKLVTIKPMYGARYFKICYAYESELKNDENLKINVMAIDLGVNNLATCVTTNYKSFIVDGKKLKSINQFYNKHMSYLKANNQYILKKVYVENTKEAKFVKCNKAELKETDDYKMYVTKKMVHTNVKRNNKIKDYIYKATNLIIQKALEYNVGTIVLGYSKTFQSKGIKNEFNKSNKIFNQKFLFIPFGKIYERLEFLCKLNSIKFVVQEESYTSVASFFDSDEIPKYRKKTEFSGKRIKRGLYETKNKTYVNADVNGALNILKKSRVCSDSVIESIRLIGVGTPMRYQVK